MKRRFQHSAPVWALLVAFLAALSCSDDPMGPDATGPGGLFVAVPSLVVAGEPFTVKVSAIGAQGSVQPDVTGTVTLSASEGMLSVTSLSLAGGTASVAVVLTGTTGSVTLTARSSDRTGKGTIATVGIRSIPGDPGLPLADVLPSFRYVPDADGFATDNAELAGLPLSFNQVMVLFHDGTTVGEANDVVAQAGAVLVGAVPRGPRGIVFLRLPAEDHAQAGPMLDALSGNARVAAAAPDVLLTGDMITRANGGNPGDWIWLGDYSGGNWGMEYIRAPQTWNLNTAIEKGGVPPIVTTIIDTGFSATHPDLVYVQLASPGGPNAHGTHVAGTIGARFDNGVGVDGANPFAALQAMGPVFTVSGATPVEEAASLGNCMMQFVYDAAAAGARLVNTSFGYNWWQFLDPSVNASAKAMVSAHGVIFKAILDALAASGKPIPFILTSAGNDSDTFGNTVSAMWGSPMANAAIQHGVPDILVVEAVSIPSPGFDPARASFSNTDGHISAPGVGVLSTSHGVDYEPMQGTSMATPHVTGIVGYLLAIDPTLSNVQLYNVLMRKRQPTIGGASSALDAFACALNIDWARGNDHVLRMLLDIDDGTVDGNLRFDTSSGTFTGEDADGDGGVGDGAIDMADFRRWRDWLLQVEASAGLSLDGNSAHPKKDVNGNNEVGTAAAENLYPRGDFNGDGMLSRNAVRHVSGVLDDNLTDLEVLQSRFDDPHYEQVQLSDLIDSGDVIVDATTCFELNPQATDVYTEVREQGTGTVVESRHHSQNVQGTEPVRQIYTVIEGEYRLVAATFNGGNKIGSEEADVVVHLGGDVYWEPACPPPYRELVMIDVEFDDLWENIPGTLRVRAGYYLGPPDETVEPTAGVAVDIDVVEGGSASPSSGTTDADGWFECTLLGDGSSEEIVFKVTLSDDDGQSSESTFDADVDPFGLVSLDGSCTAYARIHGRINHGAGTGKTFYSGEPVESKNLGPGAGGACNAAIAGSGSYDYGTNEGGEPNLIQASASSSSKSKVTVSEDTGMLYVDLSGEFSMTHSLQNVPTESASYWEWSSYTKAQLNAQSRFEIVGMPAQCTVSATPIDGAWYSLTGLGAGEDLCWNAGTCGGNWDGSSWTGTLHPGIYYVTFGMNDEQLMRNSGSSPSSGSQSRSESANISVTVTQTPPPPEDEPGPQASRRR